MRERNLGRSNGRRHFLDVKCGLYQNDTTERGKKLADLMVFEGLNDSAAFNLVIGCTCCLQPASRTRRENVSFPLVITESGWTNKTSFLHCMYLFVVVCRCFNCCCCFRRLDVEKSLRALSSTFPTAFLKVKQITQTPPFKACTHNQASASHHPQAKSPLLQHREKMQDSVVQTAARAWWDSRDTKHHPQQISGIELQTRPNRSTSP